jgi:hypothetical protein
MSAEQALAVVDKPADDGGGLLDALVLDELLDKRPARVMAFVRGGKVEAIPFTTVATVTGAERAGGDLKLILGQLQVGFDKLRSVRS